MKRSAAKQTQTTCWKASADCPLRVTGGWNESSQCLKAKSKWSNMSPAPWTRIALKTLNIHSWCNYCGHINLLISSSLHFIWGNYSQKDQVKTNQRTSKNQFCHLHAFKFFQTHTTLFILYLVEITILHVLYVEHCLCELKSKSNHIKFRFFNLYELLKNKYFGGVDFHGVTLGSLKLGMHRLTGQRSEPAGFCL